MVSRLTRHVVGNPRSDILTSLGALGKTLRRNHLPSVWTMHRLGRLPQTREAILAVRSCNISCRVMQTIGATASTMLPDCPSRQAGGVVEGLSLPPLRKDFPGACKCGLPVPNESGGVGDHDGWKQGPGLGGLHSGVWRCGRLGFFLRLFCGT
jgi:hypothetical protein